jgi:hypothetical protein
LVYSQKFYKLKKQSEDLLKDAKVVDDNGELLKTTRKRKATDGEQKTPAKRPRGKKTAAPAEVKTEAKVDAEETTTTPLKEEETAVSAE